MKTLQIKSPSFENDGYMPKKHTGFGADASPAFQLNNLDDGTVSIAITMDDLDIPFMEAYNHWLIWNIPKANKIPENIPRSASVASLRNASQGVAYGKHRYRGPKQPFFIRSTHRYVFRFYALDCMLDLDSHTRKPALLAAMRGHILQEGSITGKYKR